MSVPGQHRILYHQPGKARVLPQVYRESFLPDIVSDVKSFSLHFIVFILEDPVKTVHIGLISRFSTGVFTDQQTASLSEKDV